MVTDSGGAGKWRGGLGYTRTLLATQVPITGSQCSDRHEVKPWALFGGEPGGNGGTLIQKAGSDDWLTVKELYGKVSLEQVRQRPLRAGRPDQADHAGRRRLRRPGASATATQVRGGRARGLCLSRGREPRLWAGAAAGLIDLRGANIPLSSHL